MAWWNDYPLTSGFGDTWGIKEGYRTRPSDHVDIATPTGTVITPIKPGVVLRVGVDPQLGNYVDVQHDDGTEGRYFHGSRTTTAAGQRVSTDTPIMISGNTGSSTGPHTSLTLKRGGVAFDPAQVLGAGDSAGGDEVPGWIDSGRGYEYWGDTTTGKPILDPQTGRYSRRYLKNPAVPADATTDSPAKEATYTYDEVAPPKANDNGLTPYQSHEIGRQGQLDQRQQQLDDIGLQRQQAQDAIRQAESTRDFSAQQHWAQVDRDLRQQEFALQAELGYANSRRADVGANLNRQGQAFSQEQARRNEIVSLAQNPESYLASAFQGSGKELPGGNALFDLLRQLRTWSTPNVEAFLNQQGGLGTASSGNAATPLTGTATTAMYPAGYETQNPQASAQLAQWQAERIAAGQDPNDTEAFRQHLISIGAPDFGVSAKSGEAIAPVAVKTAPTALSAAGATQPPATPFAGAIPGATSQGQTAPAAAGLTAAGFTPNAQPLFPTVDELKATGFVPPRVAAAITPLGAAPVTNPVDAYHLSPQTSTATISPFVTQPQGGLRRVAAQTINALNPEDALALGQTYKYTGNRATLVDQLRNRAARPLVR